MNALSVKERTQHSPTTFIVSQNPIAARRPEEMGNVRCFSGVADACAALAHGPLPRLVISDLDLFDGSGLEILAAASEARTHMLGDAPPRVVLLASKSARLVQLRLRPSYWVLSERPSSLEELLARDELASRDAIPAADLLDYCLLATLGVRPVLLDVLDGNPSDHGTTKIGSVHLRSNHNWTAYDRKGSGREAFLRLTQHITNAHITCSTLPEDLVIRSIPLPVESILKDILRASRERDRASPPSSDVAPISGRRPTTEPPPPSACGPSGPRSFRPQRLLFAQPPTPRTIQGLPVVVVGSTTESFDALWEQAVDLMLTKQYADAVRVLRRASELRPESSGVATNLSRLRALGYT